MFADGPAALARPSAVRAPVAVIAALGLEGACLTRLAVAPSVLSVMQCGPGAARAAAAAARALERGAKGLVSWGLAGGLDGDAAPGSIVLPDVVVTSRGEQFSADRPWSERIAAALDGRFRLIRGALLAADAVLSAPEAKRRAARAHDAAAVDMESAAIAAAAVRARVPFVVVRAVADGAADALPPGIERWIDAHGNLRLTPAVDAVLRPSCWPALWTLALRHRTARRALEGVGRALAPQGFLLER
ncbi:MAG TPA: purine phosphorylase [Gammaproteobacteria bacterium]